MEISPAFPCTNIAEFSKNANSAYVGTVSVLYKNCLATVGVCVFRASARLAHFFWFTKTTRCTGGSKEAKPLSKEKLRDII